MQRSASSSIPPSAGAPPRDTATTDSANWLDLGELRVCVSGQDPRLLGDQPGLLLLSNPADSHDAIVFRGQLTARRYRDYLLQSASPGALVIVDQPALGVHPDVQLNSGELLALWEPLQPYLDTIARLRRIPLLGSDASRDAVLALVKAHTRQSNIEARWQSRSDQPIGYPLISSTPDARALLEKLADDGLLQRHFFERLHQCGHCASAQVFAREVCISCGCSDLTEAPLVHHYACAFQGPENLFAADDGLACPKCKKMLRHYGVDYDKPGQIVSCNGCQKTMSEPDVSFVCGDCQHETRGDDSPTHTWHSYSLTADGARAAAAGCLPNRQSKAGSSTLIELTDFIAIGRHHVDIAARCDRPLTLVALYCESRESQSLMPDRRGRFTDFLARLTCEAVRRGDLVTRHGDVVIACLPETARADALVLVERLQASIDANVSDEVDTQITYIEGDEIKAFLDELA
ncbi:MAG: hypothetical protein NXH85_09830 [Pseudomonadaceae bacterium]|nr:hypothetical protein [Pseudomonadaceae bacterium]